MASSSVSFACLDRWSPSDTAFSRISFTLMPMPSSVTTMTTSAPSRVKLTEDSPHFRLTEGGAPFGRLDAVDHGVAQHMLQRCDHAFEHLPIELRLTPLAPPSSARLPVVVGSLAHQTRQTLHVALKRHHALGASGCSAAP